MQRTQTVSRMNDWVPNRPEPEDLEKRKILKPSAAPADKKAPPPKKDDKKEEKKDKKKDEKKGGIMGLFGRKKKGMNHRSDVRIFFWSHFYLFCNNAYSCFIKMMSQHLILRLLPPQ
jgi:hypothetical protein